MNSTHIAPRDCVRFGSAPIKLATITAAEIAAIKANPIQSIKSAIHEWGHGILASLEKRLTIDKIANTVETRRGGHSSGILQVNKSSFKNFTNDVEWAKVFALTGAGGRVIDDLLITGQKHFNDLIAKKITPKQFYKLRGGGDDYESLIILHNEVKGYNFDKGDSFFTKIGKRIKEAFSIVRGWINPHKEYKLIVDWTQQSHDLLKSIPEEKLFSLAKTLDQHKTIEGHETIERLVKEALGNHYDTLQKQFNTLVAS
ncbi:MAG: hypothetical protein QE263_09465 [Vampirovibrionales bacterium]|nr:hypothetical protein [Vampirovibrionales bacterium]